MSSLRRANSGLRASDIKDLNLEAGDGVSERIVTARRVWEDYVGEGESGLGANLSDVLRNLFSEPQLPENPYFLMANKLTPYIDNSALWRQVRAMPWTQ